MDKLTQKKVGQSLDEAFIRMMGTMLPNATRHDMAIAMRVWNTSSEVKRIKRSLEKLPEPDTKALTRPLIELERYLSLLRDGVGAAAKKMASGSRGPRPTIPKDRWPELCVKLEGLHKIMPIRAAAANIANEFGIAERTVFRIWEKRNEIMKAEQSGVKGKQS